MDRLVSPDRYAKIRAGTGRSSPRLRDPEKRSLFEVHAPLRILTVVVDHSLLTEAESDPKLAYLLGLISSSNKAFAGSVPVVRRFWYADEGPPQALRRTSYGIQFTPDWVLVEWSKNEHKRGITYAVGDRIHSSILWLYDQVFDAMRRDKTPASYAALPDPGGRMRADLVAAYSAAAMYADVYVTDRDFLFSTKLIKSLKTSILRPADALPLIGLYLRQQGKFTTFATVGGSTRTTDSVSFFVLAALHLAPAIEHWQVALPRGADTPQNALIVRLIVTLAHRLGQAIAARDRTHAALYCPQDKNRPLDVLTQLDQANLLLMAAFDNAARVAHHVLNLSHSSAKNAGWRRSEWRDRITSLEPSFTDLVGPGTTGDHLLTVLGAFRNTIHYELPPIVTLKVVGQPLDTRMAVPSQEVDSVLAAIDALGGPEAWGMDEIDTDDRPVAFLSPGLFAEQLFRHATPLLDALLTVSLNRWLTRENLRPKEGRRRTHPADPSSPEAGLRIRWQLGL